MERYGIKMIFQFLIENESRILYEESIRLFFMLIPLIMLLKKQKIML